MDDVPDARDVSDATLAEMVHAAMSGVEFETATPAERGFCSVYRATISQNETERVAYVKISPDGQTWGIPTEARIQALLTSHTSIPVPEVLWATDDHDTFPTPYFFMRPLPGEDVAYEHVTRMSDDALRRLARELGACLGELHSLPAVDGFGHVRVGGPELTNDRPSGDLDSLTVANPRSDWPTYLRERVESELDRHADSRFSDLTPDLQSHFDAGIDALSGPFDSVIGRNDHGLHNLLIDTETGALTAMLDWAYTLAVPAPFDFEFAVYLTSGAYLAGLPEVSDRRALVRDAMLAGYESAAPSGVAKVRELNPLYELLAMVRIMNDFRHLAHPDEFEADVMDWIRADVRAILEE
ncbi:phosphotransferase family protein [Haladaptatus sp. GCM10025707]|uniref:phosphotransferase family protein n=1 Tax=unclassified Haladaptatus TaxID=2622732 RepID=UPI0023E869FC|nr:MULTISPECIES: aminoglycoside phosphotransferase family protein [unclassified Haladaptatus]